MSVVSVSVVALSAVCVIGGSVVVSLVQKAVVVISVVLSVCLVAPWRRLGKGECWSCTRDPLALHRPRALGRVQRLDVS